MLLPCKYHHELNLQQPLFIFHFPTEYMLCCCAMSLQLCPTLCDPMDYSPPGSSVHGILQARILKWVVCPPQGIFLTQVQNLPLLCWGRWVLYHQCHLGSPTEYLQVFNSSLGLMSFVLLKHLYYCRGLIYLSGNGEWRCLTFCWGRNERLQKTFVEFGWYSKSVNSSTSFFQINFLFLQSPQPLETFDTS